MQEVYLILPRLGTCRRDVIQKSRMTGGSRKVSVVLRVASVSAFGHADYLKRADLPEQDTKPAGKHASGVCMAQVTLAWLSPSCLELLVFQHRSPGWMSRSREDVCLRSAFQAEQELGCCKGKCPSNAIRAQGLHTSTYVNRARFMRISASKTTYD